MKNTKLKQALFTSPQSGTTKFGRYVVENEADFKKFLRVFDLLKTQTLHTLVVFTE